MVLLGMCVGWGKRHCLLHREDYAFDEKVEASAKGEDQQITPSAFPIIGFKDRKLEEEYLTDLVDVSQNRIILGYSICILLVGFGIFAYDVAGINTTVVDVVMNPGKRDYGHSKLDTFQAMLDVGLTMLFLLCGLAATVAITKFNSKCSKSVVLHIAEAVFLGMIAMMGWDFSKLSTSGGEISFPIAGWVVNLAFFYLPPFIATFLILTFAQTLEIITIALLVFLVIIPLEKNLYAQLSPSAIKTHIGSLEYLDAVCNASPVNYAACFDSTILRVSFAIVIMILIALSIVMVSFFLEKSNRRAFVSKKVVGVQKQKLQKNTQEREVFLLKQKLEHEDLIHSIFPKVVAQDLMSRQSQEIATSGIRSMTMNQQISPNSLRCWSKTVARMHKDVSILFTDIVGFTAMSQSCEPYEVMHFLHGLFIDFDDLIDIDQNLWKVETIGDAFMVASGLNVFHESGCPNDSLAPSTVYSEDGSLILEIMKTASGKKKSRLSTASVSGRMTPANSERTARLSGGSSIVSDAELLRVCSSSE
eukprot:CAMPEP_0197486364 /NCGR_PEP_ID=MMETSP1311-20131121/1281_1 /TAXON_ID=464262 /ORGANISM="Genus nov. species nov., Strain RCC856" /LENGTH=531 /DNA_ID=CAMNT_0043029401 /DNA_START=37 /DNA_END=1629 /DNA_ORIENTATION=-